MKMKSKFLKTIKATWLCIRFPFLYPRNRFTGKHYNNWTIIDFHRKYYQYLYQFFFLDVKKISELSENTIETKDNRKKLQKSKSTGYLWLMGFDKNTRNVFIRVSGDPKIGITINESNVLKSGEILDAVFIDGRETIIVSDDAVKKENFSRAIKIDLQERLLKWIIRFLDWINDYPLQWIHCLTSHTELDDLDSGWRKNFGIKICKDIRRQLIKEGRLFSYRITQIKEKYGELRWYDNGSSDEIQKIIAKYEDISRRTCIICGKPATKISSGYVCPFCDEHIEDRKYTPIEEYYGPEEN